MLEVSCPGTIGFQSGNRSGNPKSFDPPMWGLLFQVLEVKGDIEVVTC